MEVDRVELIEVLTKIKPGIATKEFLEQSTHFILNDTEIISYNDEISIVCPFDIGIVCTVDAGLLYKLIAKMDEDTISFNLNKNIMEVECGDTKAELPIIIDSEILDYVDKLFEEQDKLEKYDLPEDFLDAVRLCAFSASRDRTLGTLTCVWIEGKDVLTSDKYRASWYQMKSAVEKNFYIEAEYVKELSNFEDPVDYCLSRSWVHFNMANGIVFSARLTTPDKLLPLKTMFEEFEHSVRIPIPAALKEAIDTAALTVESEEKLNQRVVIEFGEDLIRCIGASQKGKIEKEIHLHNNLNIEPFAIEASPKAMIEVLDKTTHLLVGKSKGLFKSREKKGFQHLIGLIIKED